MKTSATRIKRLLPVLAAMLALFVPAFGAPPATDDYISDAVRQKLAADQVVKGGAIDVEVKGGVVTLKGKVQEPKQKNKADKLARKVRGVKSVVNDLMIEKP